MWTVLPEPLNQGDEGACVGFAWSHELAAAPVEVRPIDDAYAFRLYALAQAADRAMGNSWPEGASVLAGAKACAAEGLISEYRWAFSVAEVVDTILGHGPVILGIPWLSGMYDTGPGGLVQVTGSEVGGHAIMAMGYLPDYQGHGEVIAWQNSWGPGYGLRGIGYIRLPDLAALLAQQGEACVPTDTPLGPTPEPQPEPEPKPEPTEPAVPWWQRLLSWLAHLLQGGGR